MCNPLQQAVEVTVKLKIVRRWGSHLPGETVDVSDEEQAYWLLNNSFAERSNQPGTAYGNPPAPGEAGPDPRAGGDVTRRYPATIRGDREAERANPQAGSPVQYNAGVREEPAAAAAGGAQQPVPGEGPKGRRRG
jgi:hypothetical protein